jgi:2-keto-4-pentenoate hydratase/2-oxohepta-3-ene-1,7-dioic acid hydratase in catechol pathway
MKLATFIESNHERFGLVLPHPAAHEDWIFDPWRTQERLLLYASRGTSALFVSKPQFFSAPLPHALADFLAQGQPALDALRRMHDFLLRFLEQADAYILLGAGFPLRSVKLCAPIPRPRLFFGLVQNSPTVWRHDIRRTHLNLFPQGHQRPQGSVLGPGDPVVLPAAERIEGGWNPELGVIIGRGGRNIPVGEALAHVAGLTVVSDVTYDYFRQQMFQQPAPYDWFEDAMSSWGDKKSDARSPMGPYLVTLDEIGNPYDLLIYTRQNGYLRDRSHTGAMALSIERTVHWLSTIRTLQPGDVIHMGTMGYDGSPHLQEIIPGAQNYIESEIEKIGVLRNPFVIDTPEQDWRDPQEESRQIHPSPVVRDLLRRGAARIERADWQVQSARHFWVVFGNDQAATAREGWQQRPYPRFLAVPDTALATPDQGVKLPAGAGRIRVSSEIACVIGRLTRHVTPAEAAQAIAGYAPLLSVQDLRLADSIIEPASAQERNLPYAYARWYDGSNLIGALVDPALVGEIRCELTVDGIGTVANSSTDYIFDAPQVIAFIAQYITLFPGDVVTLGRLPQVLEWHSENGATYAGRAALAGLGEITFTINAS